MADNRGVVYLGNGQVQVQSIPFPKMQNPQGKPIHHGVILRVVSTNICGSDQHMVRGRTTAQTGLVLGHEITGEVIEAGRDVEHLKVGDLVSVPFNVACGRCRSCKEQNTGVCLTVNPARPGGAYGYVDMADWYTESDKLVELDQRLDTLKWQRSPLEDLQSLLATLAVNSLPDAPLATLRPLIDEVFSHNSVPAIVARLRAVTAPDTREWANDTANLLETRSPLAMAVTLQMLRHGRELTLEQCFQLELHLDRQWFDRGDLIEGVRALIIDKDKTPHWNPATLDQLDDNHVASFFTDFKPSEV